MREIKFRGQMTTGEWVYGLPSHDLPNSTAYYNECSYRISWEPESGGRANAPIKNGALGQYTGLKDKNGKEIYEGDIFGSPDQLRCIVERQKDGAYVLRFIHPLMRDKKISILDQKVSKSPIIGNIYENPELI